MVLWLLLAFLLGLTGLVYAFGERNVASPSLLFLFGWDACAALVLVNQRLWNYHISWLTAGIVALGAVEWVVVCALVKSFFVRSSQQPVRMRELDHPRVSLRAILAVDAIIAMAIVVYGVNIIAITGFSSIGHMLERYKFLTSISHAASQPGYSKQLFRLAQLLSFVLAAVAARDIVFPQGPRRELWVRWAAVGSGLFGYLILSSLSSDRLTLMSLLLAVMVLTLMYGQAKRGLDGLPLKTLAIAAGGVALMLVGFIGIAPLVGRTRNEGPLEYLALYGGGSIPLLDHFLHLRPMSSTVWGMESFYSWNLKLFDSGRLPGVTSFPPIHLEQRYFENHYMGNVYSAYRRWIYDFGLFGAAVLQFVVATVCSLLWSMARFGRGRNRLFWTALYGYIVYTIIMHPIDSYMTVVFFSLTTLNSLVLLYVSTLLMRHLHIEIRPVRLSWDDRVLYARKRHA